MARDLFNQLAKAQFFTALDVRGAYHRLRVAEGDEWKTAFRTHFGLYECLVMWEGLTNAPADFQAFMNKILAPFLGNFAAAFFDDVMIFSETEEKHKEHVRAVLKTFKDNHVFLRLPKCKFHVKETEYLGFIIGTNGISMDPSKSLRVKDWEPPSNVTEVQEFIGFANFYRRFIRDFSRIVKPITRITGNEGFQWEAEQVEAFAALKEAFSSAPVLKRFDPDRKIVLETDASDVACGGALSQYDDGGRLHPIDFFSKSHTPAECNYDIYDRELLAIIKCFRYWRSELLSPDEPTDVITDHQNLQTFMTTKVLTPRQVRWANFLSQFNFIISYRPGKKNGKADYLSRMPGVMPKGGGKIPQHRLQRILKDENLAPELQKIAIELNAIVIAANDNLPTLRETLEQACLGDGNITETLRQLDAGDRQSRWISIADCQRDGNLLRYHGKLVVPDSSPLRLRIIQEFHDSPHAGHQGRAKTIELIDREYWWKELRKDTERFVRNCHTCRRAKTSRHSPFGILRPLPVPGRAWQHISMDFVVGLPEADGYNAIWVVVDRLTKQRHYIPCRETVDAKKLAELFVQHVWRLHGLPDTIISDRGGQFAGDFWTYLCGYIGVDRKLSTAFHPQTDGQTERINAIMEQYLRCYVNYAQDDWVKHLPLAEFAGNNAASETLGCSPFFAMHGYDPKTIPNFEPDPPRNLVEQEARQRGRTIRDIQGHCAAEMRRAQLRQAEQYDRRHAHAPDYQPGDLVWFDARNVRTERNSRKLDNPRIGPIPIEEKISGHAYKLKLPRRLGIHPVQPVTLLEPVANDPFPGQHPAPPPPVQGPEGPEYLVDEILNSRRNRHGNLSYLVRWLGYHEDTWEPAQELEETEAAELFHRRFPDKPRPDDDLYD